MQKELHVALYVRVSTDDQVDGHSLAAQEVALREDAKRRGKLVYKVYQDAGVSGAREDRPGLSDLLHDARRGLFGEVLVWTVSRISRNLAHLLKVVEEIQAMNITFRSLSEQLDITTPMGQFALTMMGAVAQMQRESWMESSHIGMKKRAQSGRWGGGMMLGYRMVPDEEDPRGGGRLEIVPAEAVTVQQIFDLYASGMGYKAIANRLNQEGKKGKMGKAFTISTVSGILANAAYVGKTRFGNDYFDGLHEPILSEAVWEAVEKRRSSRSRPVRKTIGREYLLSGVLKCPACGAGMVPQHTKNRRSDGSCRINHYYACGKYLNKGSTACHANSVRADDAEEKVLENINQILTNTFWVRRISAAIRERYEAEARPLDELRKDAEARLSDIAKGQADLLRRYESDRIERDTFLAEMQALKAEKETCQKTLAESSPGEEMAARCSEDDLRDAFGAFRKVLEQAEADKKRELIRNMIAAVKVNEVRQVSEIELRLPTMVAVGDAAEIMPLSVAM